MKKMGSFIRYFNVQICFMGQINPLINTYQFTYLTNSNAIHGKLNICYFESDIEGYPSFIRFRDTLMSKSLNLE